METLSQFRANVNAGLSEVASVYDAEWEVMTQAVADARQNAEELKGEVAFLETELETTTRYMARFRHALFVYLQERDGPAGRNAPTPETLAEIREVLEAA